MDPFESIRVALEALSANELRSGLTMLGIIIGVSAVIAKLNDQPIQTLVASSSIILAVGVSLTIGLLFGVYPAYRASSLRPIDALRYE